MLFCAQVESLGHDLNEGEDLLIGEDSREREGLAQGTSDNYRGVEPNIHENPMASIPYQETRALSSRVSKRRRLLTSANVVQFCEEPSQSMSSFNRPISPSPDMEVDISSIVSPDKPVSPDWSVLPDNSNSPYRSVLPDRSVSPNNSVLPDRPVSPDWSASPVAAIIGRGRGQSQRERGHGAVEETRRGNPVTSSVDISTTTTPTVQGRKKGPVPRRGSSKDTPASVTFEAIHPFNEDVGPTKILPASAKAIDFFCKCLTMESWSI